MVGGYTLPAGHRFRVAHNPVHWEQVLRQGDSLSHTDGHACLAGDWRLDPPLQILLRS